MVRPFGQDQGVAKEGYGIRREPQFDERRANGIEADHAQDREKFVGSD